MMIDEYGAALRRAVEWDRQLKELAYQLQKPVEKLTLDQQVDALGLADYKTGGRR